MDTRVGLWRKLSAEELMLLNCGVGEDSWVPRSARRFNQSILKEISPEYSGRTDAEGKTPILWPPDAKSWLIWSPWCWERLRTGGEGDNRGWDGWMASQTRWTWVWVNSGSWWWTGRPGMLRFMGSQRVGHDWAAELNRTDGKLDDMQYRWEVSSFHSVVIQRSPISKNIWYFKKFLDFLSLQTLWSCYQVVGTRNLHLTGFPMWYWFSSVFKSY